MIIKIVTILISLIFSAQKLPVENIDLNYIERNDYVKQYCIEQESEKDWYSFIDANKVSTTYGYYGFKNTSNDNVIIPAQYDIIYKKCFDSNSEFYIAAIPNKGWCYIDKSGKFIIQSYTFDAGPDIFMEGLSRYKENEKVGFINKDLEIVIPAQFTDAYSFKNGFAKVCNDCKRDLSIEHSKLEGGKWGVVDKNGIITWDKE